MSARHRFVLATLEPDANLAELCREAGISRKTGFEWLARVREPGLAGLEEMSTRPRKSSLDESGEAVLRILAHRNLYPHWGARKLRVDVARRLEADQVPSDRAVARILARPGEIRTRRRPSVNNRRRRSL